MEDLKELRKMLSEESHAAFDEMTNWDQMSFFTEEKKLSIAEWKGHKMQPTFPADTVQFAFEEWTPREGDVFVVAFPKTGFTWTCEVVRHILFGRDPDLYKLFTLLPLGLLETGRPNKFKVLDGIPSKRRLIITHLPATVVNVEKIKKANAKVIYVLRNPKDQAVSWFKFLPNMPHLQAGDLKELFSLDWETFLKNFTEGKMPIGMRDGEWYPDHVLSWLEHRDDKNVMFYYYEDMKKDLCHEISKMAKYLEVDNITEDDMRSIAEKCDFSAMKKQSETGTSMADQIRRQIKLLRKGGVGGWKDHFTVAQSEWFDAIFEDKLKDKDVKFTYEL